MVRSQYVLTDGKGTLKEWACLCMRPLCSQQRSQVAEEGTYVRMVWPLKTLANSEGALKEWASLCTCSLCYQQLR